MGTYDKMTNDDFLRILSDIVKEEGAELLTVPGVYDVVAEWFNNEVLDRWTAEQADKG